MRMIKGKHAKKNKFKINKIFLMIPIIIVVLITILLIHNNNLKQFNNYSKNYIKKNKLTKEIGKINHSSIYGISSIYYINYPKFSNNNLDSVIDSIKKSILGNTCKKCIIDYESYNSYDGVISVAFIETKMNKKKSIDYKKVYTVNLDSREEEKLKDTYIFIGKYESKITDYIDNYLNSNEKLKKNLKQQYKNVINKDTDYKYVLSKDGIVVYFNSDEIIKSKDIIKIVIPYDEMKDYLNIDTTISYKSIKEVKSTKEKFSDNKKVMYVKRLSNIYSSNSRNSDVINTIDKGKKVAVKKSSKNYSLIKYKNKDGYILNNYLSDEIVADKGYTDTNEVVYASEDIVIRKGINDTDEELVKLALGDSITRIGTSENGFSEVVYNNEKGFVKSSYLLLFKPNPNAYINIDKSKNINAKGGMVALTFDDGPNPSSTNRILDTLQKYNAVATFFDLGKLAVAYPDVVKRELSIGCEVGSHTYGHVNLNNLSAPAIKNEIESSKNAFISVLGKDVGLIRPPYGNANELVKANLPYPIINWNVDTLDWKTRNKDAIVNEVRKIDNLDGKIVLMHSIYETTADAVEVIVPELIKQGYQLVTVSQLAYYKCATLTPGKKYFGF